MLALASLAAPSSALADTYDGSLQTAETWSGVVSGVVDWTFDQHFRVVAERVRGSAETTFTYDADGLLTGAGALTLTRDAANGFITTATVGSVTTTFAYNDVGEVVSEETAVAGATLFRAKYTRDAGGRLAQKTETLDALTTTEAFTYDLAGRLTDVQRGGLPAAHYEYDANGNRTLAVGDGLPAAAT